MSKESLVIYPMIGISILSVELEEEEYRERMMMIFESIKPFEVGFKMTLPMGVRSEPFFKGFLSKLSFLVSVIKKSSLSSSIGTNIS